MENILVNAQTILTNFPNNQYNPPFIFNLSQSLGLLSVEQAVFGFHEIKDPSSATEEYSFICVANKDESVIILFLYGDYPVKKWQDEAISMFCVKGDVLYEYKNHQKKTLISKESILGFEGLNMLAVGKKFVEGSIESELVETPNDFIRRIVTKIRSL